MEKFDGFMLGDLMEEDKDTIRAFLSQSLDSYAEGVVKETLEDAEYKEAMFGKRHNHPKGVLCQISCTFRKEKIGLMFAITQFAKAKFGIDLTQNK